MIRICLVLSILLLCLGCKKQEVNFSKITGVFVHDKNKSFVNLTYNGEQYPFEVNNDGILVYKPEYRFVNPRLLRHDDINKEAYGIRKLRKH